MAVGSRVTLTQSQANDTNKSDLKESTEIVDSFAVGNVVLVTGGRKCGRVAIILKKQDKEIILVQGTTRGEFVTHIGNVVPFVEGGKLSMEWATLLDEHEELRKKMRRRKGDLIKPHRFKHGN